MWNNVYDIDKRHPATVVKQENLDYEYKKNNFYMEQAKIQIIQDFYKKKH